MPVSQVLLLVSFLLISIQDFKQKAVHIVLYISAFMISLYYSYDQKGIMMLLYDSFINIGLILFILGLVCIYFFVKLKKIESPINKQIGSGDIVFFVILSILFEPILFILFITLSQIIILLISAILIMIKGFKNKSPHIPLAGALALCYIFFSMGVFIFPDGASFIQNYLINIT